MIVDLGLISQILGRKFFHGQILCRLSRVTGIRSWRTLSTKDEGFYLMILLIIIPSSVGEFIFKPSHKGPPLQHETEIEIYIVTQGKGQITFDNKRNYALKPNHMLYVPSKTLLETVNTGEEDLVFYGVCLQ